MNHYNNQSRPVRRQSGAPNRRDSGKRGFLSVLLFYVLPFIAINGLIFFLATEKPKGDVTIAESSDYISTTMELKISSILPLTATEVFLDGTPVEIKKSGARTYTAALQNNGVLEVKLTCFNKMKTVLYEQVNVLDDTPPAIKDKVFKDGILSFRLEDSQSGVNYSSISAYNEDKPIIQPLSIDKSTGLVMFEIKKGNLTVSAKDKIGNEMHVTFNPRGENVEEDVLEDETQDEEDISDENSTNERSEKQTSQTQSVFTP